MRVTKDLTVDDLEAGVANIGNLTSVTTDPSNPTNLYLFGPSTMDTGGLAFYYPNVINAMTPIPGTNLRSVIQLQVGGFPFTFQYNTENRHSDGICSVEYFAQKLGMPVINAFDITKLPSYDGNIINYAVSGATALGCTWNAFPNPQTFANVAGANGIVDQVDKFLAQRAASNKTINPNDLFAFVSQNINDIGVIASEGPGAPAAIAASVAGVLSKMQDLYDLGARHIMFQLVGNGSILLNIIPGFIRLDVVVPGTINALSGVSNNITDAYISALSTAVAPGGPMSELDLILTDTATIASQIYLDRGRFGIRSSLLSDPDPRYPGGFAITSSFVVDGNVLTVTATGGNIIPELVLVGGGVTSSNIKIVGQITGLAGGIGTYVVDTIQPAGVAPTSLATVPSLPFPTMIEQALVVQPTRKLDRKVFFVDDTHFTQTGQLFHADYFVNFFIPFKPVIL